ncbi:MAG: hypothetical protein ACSHW7_14890 [Patiriisocius sp.]|uniref:hypothetical protein n=1 Tax=Patiriisocius sp. TaxID=2822396 RepID=UPI003EF8FB43
MKTIFFFVTLSLALFFGIKPVLENYSSKDSIEITFDGYEGGHYFFTSENGRAIQFLENEHTFLEDKNFENGTYIGQSFEIQFSNEISENELDAPDISFN